MKILFFHLIQFVLGVAGFILLLISTTAAEVSLFGIILSVLMFALSIYFLFKLRKAYSSR